MPGLQDLTFEFTQVKSRSKECEMTDYFNEIDKVEI